MRLRRSLKMKYSGNIREEELKNKVGQDFFARYDSTEIKGFIDFAVKLKRPANAIDFADEYLLWAEAKQKPTDIIEMLTQLVLTIGKARTFDKILPPPFLGCFDCEKIAFVPYADIQEIFYLNDFNWKVAPSNHETREFKLIKAHIEKIINHDEKYVFDFLKDEKVLKQFIVENFIVGKTKTSKIKIDKNNFIIIYNKWIEEVQPSIWFDWVEAKKWGIISGDFYLADLLSDKNTTLKENLFVVLRSTIYEMNRFTNELKAFTSTSVKFTDQQEAHSKFWAKYERPPIKEYWDYIVDRRDLLVPQDIRERKGSFYTPKIWVELSQKYMAEVFGENWQEEYYVWDCAAGTGNLLAGLTNKYRIWASTLDKADVDVMKDRIQNGANLVESHVFQFDFLNDDFEILPKSLLDIIKDEEKRKKLIIYINPPYAEHGNRTTFAGDGEHKAKVSTTSKVYHTFQNIVGTATRELYAQFFLRIFKEIPNAKLASFSTLKFINAPNFYAFRYYFYAEFLKGFICKANTFDNVDGNFPIGFLIWDLSQKNIIDLVSVDVLDDDGRAICKKNFFVNEEKKYLIDWFRQYIDRRNNDMGSLRMQGNDVQQHNNISISSVPTKNDIIQKTFTYITKSNLIGVSIYFTVRQIIEPTWINNRDQFLYPNADWQNDDEFQNDCLAYTLFNNNIQSRHGKNQWIPFTETEVNARDNFESNFMTDFIKERINIIQTEKNFVYDVESKYVFSEVELPMAAESEIKYNVGKKHFLPQQSDYQFSNAAQNVFNAGRELWRYYHTQKFPSIYGGVDAEGGRGGYNVNASLYDIREHFQGRNDKGKMNNKSDNETYNALIGNLRTALKTLAKKIEPKVFEYGFLRG